MRSVVRLTASATAALPRPALLTICFIYAAFGLFGRDPWKNEDAAGFGTMWTVAHGDLHAWLLPNLFGRPMTDDGPLMAWLGAGLIRLLQSFIDPSDASRIATLALLLLTCALVWYGCYLLGRRPEVQPFKYAFGGEPLPRDYGRTMADGGLLVLLACFGLAERGHETTPQLAQLALVSLLLYGLIRSFDKPVQGALCWGAGLGLFTLASHPLFGIAVGVSTLVVYSALPGAGWRRFASIGVPLALVLAGFWPLLAYAVLRQDAVPYLSAWAQGADRPFQGPDSGSLFYILKNFPLFAWPAWPLALWSCWSWAGYRRAPHIAVPLAVVAPILVLLALQSSQTNRYFILTLPSLSILAAFALPTLKRGTINAIDWFAVLSFTILSVLVWLFFCASMTGFPAPMARNLARQLPGYVPSFNPLALLIAIGVTVAWIALARWRLARRPKVLWRSVVLSSAGTTLMWVLLMTLWLPMINYSRTYHDVALQLAANLPPDYKCVLPVRVGNAQMASFGYFGNVRFGQDRDNCDVLLRQDADNFSEPGTQGAYVWKAVWQGRRATDRDEMFRLYVLEPRGGAPRRAPSTDAR